MIKSGLFENEAVVRACTQLPVLDGFINTVADAQAIKPAVLKKLGIGRDPRSRLEEEVERWKLLVAGHPWKGGTQSTQSTQGGTEAMPASKVHPATSAVQTRQEGLCPTR